MLDESASLVGDVAVEQTPNFILPTPLTPLVGREQEVKKACSLLQQPEVRLVTFTGTGGIGKTRLSTQVAHELLPAFPDGIFFVSLASLNEPDLVIVVIAQMLGLGVTSERPLFIRLQEFLAGKRLLLLLDNFEQVTPAAKHIVELLTTCPHVKALVTSRSVLRVRGEYEFAVPPLVLPDPQRSEAIEVSAQNPSIMLFVQRATAIRPSFQLTDANVSAIAQLCVRLDGLPLAIELAAAQSKVLSPPTLLARLEHRLDVLTSGAQDLPERQQTLRNTIRWSYELLSVNEQRLFRSLSVFGGGCDLEAIEVLLKDASIALPALDGVTSLLDKSLLLQRELPNGAIRFYMLETIREYGLECLAESEESKRISRIHADYMLALAEEAEQHINGSEQAVWLERLDREHDNLREALLWLLEQKDAERLLRLSAALYWFWSVRGHLGEGRSWLQRALANSEGATKAARAKVLHAAGALAYNEDEHEQSKLLCEESLALCREIGDAHGCAQSLYWLGQSACWTQHDYKKAMLYAQESLQLFEQTHDTNGVADALLLLAYITMNQGMYAEAIPHLQHGFSLFSEVNDLWGVSYTLHYLGRIHFSVGNFEQSHKFLEECLTVSRQIGYRGGRAHTLSLLGNIALKQNDLLTARALIEEGVALNREAGGNINISVSLAHLAKLTLKEGDYDVACALYKESLSFLEKVDDKEQLATCLEGLAEVLVAQRREEQAAQLLGNAAHIRQQIGTPIFPVDMPDYTRSLAQAKSSLGNVAFSTAFSAGQTMTVTQMLATQQQGRITDASPTRSTFPLATPSLAVELTEREREVLSLVTTGLTNAQIARQLSISTLTVNAHLRSIYQKLGVTTRSAATRYAIEHHLV
jgi:predicted ATPase/DNA-binding CsgD family transcriptional regulator